MLTDKVIVITGGAGLLGREFSKAVVKYEGIGIIADYNEKIGRETVEQIKYELDTDKVEFVKMDITNIDSISNLIFTLKNKYGRIDDLVNNAYPRNKNYGRHFFDVEYEDFCENLNMHLGGYFLTSQQFIKFFLTQGYGNIINISSIYGVIPPRFEIYDGTSMTVPIEYALTKSAIIHFTKYLSKYLIKKNIKVNSISPGGIFDNQPECFINAYKTYTSAKGMLDKTDIVGTLLFLLSDGAKYINGQNIIIDDGFTL